MIESNTWQSVNPESNTPHHGRLGHSAVTFQKSMIIFGGEKSYNKHLKMRECLSDVKTFNFGSFIEDSQQWNYV